MVVVVVVCGRISIAVVVTFRMMGVVMVVEVGVVCLSVSARVRGRQDACGRNEFCCFKDLKRLKTWPILMRGKK